MNVKYIILCFASLFILGLIDNSRGPIYPEILNQFNIPKSTGSIIFSLSSIVSFGVALSSRFWLKRFGAIVATKFAVLTHLVATVMMGFAAMNQESFKTFVLASGIFGIGVGILSISLNIIIANVIPIQIRQKVFSGLHSMYGLASLLAPGLLSAIFHFDLSWQKYFVLLGILPLSLILYAYKIKSQGLTQNSSTSLIVPRDKALKLGVLFSFYVASEVMLSSRLVVYLKEIWNMPLDKGSAYLSLFFLLLLAGRLLFALVKIRVEPIKLLKGSMIFSILFLLLGMFLHPFFLTLIGGSMSFFFPCGMSWLSTQYEQISEGLIAAVMTFVGGMLVSMHWIVGVISDVYGLNKALFLGVTMLTTVLYILHTENKALPKTT